MEPPELPSTSELIKPDEIVIEAVAAPVVEPLDAEALRNKRFEMLTKKKSS